MPAWWAGISVYLLILSVIVLSFPRQESFLAANRFHHPVSDAFFVVLTHVGDGVTAIVLGMLLLFFKIRFGILMLVGYLTSSGFVQLLKRVFFDDVKRPALELWNQFNYTGEVYVVKGVEPLLHHSFPSGHSSTSMCMFLILCYIFPKKGLSVVFFFCAVLAAYSRIYLAHHYFRDVLAGSVIGLSFAFLAVFIFRQKEFGAWMERPLIKLN